MEKASNSVTESPEYLYDHGDSLISVSAEKANQNARL